MKMSVIACAVVAVAGTYSLVHYGHTRQQMPVAVTTPAANLATVKPVATDMNAEVQRLGAELLALRHDLSNRNQRDTMTTPSAPSDASAQSAAPDPLARAEALAEADRQFEDHAAQVARSFSNESRDSRFVIDAGEALRSALGDEELARMPVQNIDCRSSTCRLEINDDGSGAVAQVLPMLTVRMAGTLPYTVAQRVEQPSGNATMVLYMSK